MAGYTCQKATTRYEGRDYVAWFAPKIPISDGPYKFSGLPGLIVEIADTKEYYRFELTGLSKVPDGIPITFNEKKDRTIKLTIRVQCNLKRFMVNTVEFYEQEGFFPADDAHRKRLQERYKQRNNTIEVLHR